MRKGLADAAMRSKTFFLSLGYAPVCRRARLQPYQRRTPMTKKLTLYALYTMCMEWMPAMSQLQHHATRKMQ